MTLRDCMVYAGIQTSRSVAKLNWFQRDFFRGVLHACDDYGRFEADAGLLRTVLYAPMLDKVTERDVKGALLRCAEASVGLIKLYTVRDRGYGKVVNYRQTNLKRRRALYPDEDDADDPDLFSTAPPGDAPIQRERKKEGRGSARGAPKPPPPRFVRVETAEECVARLRDEWPHIDIDAELALALKNRRKVGKELDLVWFEEHWLPKCGPKYQAPSQSAAAAPVREPEGWLDHLRTVYGHLAWVQALPEDARFPDLPKPVQLELVKEIKRSA